MRDYYNAINEPPAFLDRDKLLLVRSSTREYGDGEKHVISQNVPHTISMSGYHRLKQKHVGPISDYVIRNAFVLGNKVFFDRLYKLVGSVESSCKEQPAGRTCIARRKVRRSHVLSLIFINGLLLVWLHRVSFYGSIDNL